MKKIRGKCVIYIGPITPMLALALPCYYLLLPWDGEGELER